MRKTLTDKGVAALKPRAQRYAFPDPEMRGHYVRVQPSGARSFAAVTRDSSGKQIWLNVGSADVTTIEEAREAARTALKRIKAGLPAFASPPVKPDSFRSVAENWLKRHVEKEKLRTQYEIERCLNKYVFPRWADRDFVSIKRSDVASLLDQIEDQHGSRMADLVLALVRSIANWFASRDDDYVSPFVRGMRRHQNGPRSRILSDAELRTIWKAAEANGQFGAIIRLLLLTGQRREKLYTMKWSDAVDGVWTIATVAREKGNAGALALPAQAVAIINSQPRVGDNPYVFAAGRGNGRRRSMSRSKLAFDATLPKMPRWTLHDLRRTSRSLLSRCGVAPHVSERVLGHAIVGIEGVYDRHRYDAEKASALQHLATLIESIVNPRDNVTPIRKRGKGR
jgi:integrase